MSTPIQQFFKEHGISEVEAVVPDMAGIARGKVMPAMKFAEDEGMRMPESIFLQTVTGDYPDDDRAISPSEIDIVLKADPNTTRVDALGRRTDRAGHPRQLLLGRPSGDDGATLRAAPHPRPVRAEGLEADRRAGARVLPRRAENIDADYPLKPPVGRSGRPEIGRQSYSIAAVNEFDPLFDDIYAFCEAQEIEIDTLIHEDGAAQMEINLIHGDAMSLADQVFMFKRTAREAAFRHKMYATFMAKPMAREPGSAMHIHQSIVDAKTGKNVFSDKDGNPTPLFFSHIAGLQKYLPQAMALFAPNVNSFRRIILRHLAPINTQWGYDNRTAGLRVPISNPDNRRVENRLAGADANPYLALAASLACGYLAHAGRPEAVGARFGQRVRPAVQPAAQPRGIGAPAARLPHADRHARRPVRAGVHRGEGKRAGYVPAGHQQLGTRALAAERLSEQDTFLQVISSWEREHLLLNV